MGDKTHQKSKRISKVLQSFTKEDMQQLGVTTSTTTQIARLDPNTATTTNTTTTTMRNNIPHNIQTDIGRNDFHQDGNNNSLLLLLLLLFLKPFSHFLLLYLSFFSNLNDRYHKK